MGGFCRGGGGPAELLGGGGGGLDWMGLELRSFREGHPGVIRQATY